MCASSVASLHVTETSATVTGTRIGRIRSSSSWYTPL
jgi:hypothetical protein